jgi:hypothetical protein
MNDFNIACSHLRSDELLEALDVLREAANACACMQCYGSHTHARARDTHTAHTFSELERGARVIALAPVELLLAHRHLGDRRVAFRHLNTQLGLNWLGTL